VYISNLSDKEKKWKGFIKEIYITSAIGALILTAIAAFGRIFG
jgi:hypothetical protein